MFLPLRHHPGPVMIFPKGLKDATFGDEVGKTEDVSVEKKLPLLNEVIV